MGLNEEGLAAATATIGSRGWSDFKRTLDDHRFGLLAAVLGILGAGLGALAPSDASVARQVLTAAAGAFVGVSLSYAIPLTWSLLRAPFRQRRELIEHLRPGDGPEPVMTLVPATDLRVQKPIGMTADRFLSVAFVRVYNAQERGGDAAKAEHVTPEIKVFAPGDRLVFHHKGWDSMAWREFTVSQEEHALWLVAKYRDEDGCFIVQQEDATPVKHLPDDAYTAEITLRGYFPDSPICKRFAFSSRGKGTDLSFEAEDS